MHILKTGVLQGEKKQTNKPQSIKAEFQKEYTGAISNRQNKKVYTVTDKSIILPSSSSGFMYN